MSSSSTRSPTLAQAEQKVKRETTAATQEADNIVQELVVEDADSTESNVRYAAYARRLTDIARAGSRYTAYTSDIGEAFRPVVPPMVVTAAYGVSWAYLIGDVAFTTYKSSQQGPNPLEAATMSEPMRLSMVAVKRSVFQSVASMALPAFTIHTAVKQMSKAVRNSPNVTLKKWGPTAVGISIVPALPFVFDHPVETAVDYGFDKIEAMFFKAKHDPSVPTPKGEL